MDYCVLTHWGQVMHICVNKLTIIGSDNGLSPGQYQAIIWTNVGLLLIGPLETNYNEILSKIYIFSSNAFENVRKLVANFSQPQCNRHESVPR